MNFLNITCRKINSITLRKDNSLLFLSSQLFFRTFSSKLFNNCLSSKFPNNLKNNIDAHNSVSVATLNLTHINVNVNSLTYATANDGNCYEDKVYKKFVDIFGESNVARECDISNILHSFKANMPKSQLQGIDFIIRAKHNDIWTLFAMQVKIGARTRDITHVVPFVRTLRVLQKFVSHDKNHSLYGLQIVPIWFSSACLDDSAKKLLKNNFVHCFIDSAWSIDIDNCKLFTNFINKLLTKNTYK